MIKNDPKHPLRDTFGPGRQSQHVSKSSTKQPLAGNLARGPMQKNHSIDVSKAQHDVYQQKQQIKRELKLGGVSQ
jgi:hypothetical protein